MTGSVPFCLTVQWTLSCSLCYIEFGYLLLWEDGITCSCLQMFATHNVRVVFCNSGSILFVTASFMSLEFDMLTSYAFLRIDSESQMPLMPCSIPILSRTRLNAAKIVNCVYNFLLRYSGTFIKNSILSSVKICCCVCLHFASLVLVRYLIA